MPVPHSHPWFLGVANLRGHLHGVVDLAGFLGVKRHASRCATSRAWWRSTPRSTSTARCWSTACRACAAKQQLTRADRRASGPRPPFVGARYTDESGRMWQELNLAALASDEAFLRIVG